MRKVFLSIMLLRAITSYGYVSRDIDINTEKCFAMPMTYIIDKNVEEGDEVVIATVLQPDMLGTKNQTNHSYENYKIYKQEIEETLKDRNITLSYIEVDTEKDFESNTFHTFFRSIAKIINDDDQVFLDITFGMKPYALSMFISATYAIKACKNAEIGTIIYAQKYSGQAELEENAKPIIYDLTGLFFINSIAGQLKPGQKQSVDSLFDFIIG